jgi:phage shock protein E
VVPLVFKTSERRAASLAGSIPVRLRYLHAPGKAHGVPPHRHEAFPARKLNGNDTRARLGAAVAQVIDRETVRRLIEQGAQIVDVLPAEEYGEDHLPGAINLPLRKIEIEASRALDHVRPIVVYCADSA